MHNASEQKGPWYRQFWLWFVLAPPMTSIVVGLSLLGTSIINRDAMVVGDYDKVGRAMHMYVGRELLAAELGVNARVHIDGDGVSAILQGLPEQPERLKLYLMHPTHAERDLDLVLARNAAGVFQADSNAWRPGRWYVRLEPETREWRLAGYLAFGSQELNLEPRSEVN